MKLLKFAYILPGVILALTLQGCAGIVIGAAATGASVAHDRRTTGTVVEDESIEIKASSALNDNQQLREQSHINIISYNNIVLLTGEAPTEALRKRAEQIVQGVEKVRQVHNEITIGAPSAMGARSSDSLLTAKVKTNLLTTKIDPTRIKVVTEAGTVYLMGLVTHAQGETAGAAVRTVGGVQRVVKIFEYLD